MVMSFQSISQLVIATVLTLPQGEPPSAGDVEDAKRVVGEAWAAREAIEFGRFDIHLQGYSSKPGRELTSELRAKIWFSGEKLRIEKQQFLPVIGRDAEGAPSTEKYIFTPESFCSYDTMITERGARLMAQTGKREQESRDVTWLQMFRLYGTVPPYMSGLDAGPLESLLGKNVVGGGVQPASHEGSEAVEAVYEMTGSRTKAFTLVPSMGFSVVRAELLAVHPARKSEPIRNVIASELQQYEGGVWFPSAITFTLRVNEEVVSEEVMTIENADFSRRPEDDLFTLESLEIPPGHEVHDRAAQEILDWDGEKLVNSQAPPPSDPEVGARRFWFYTSLVTGGLGAALVAFLVFRPRGKEKT